VAPTLVLERSVTQFVALVRTGLRGSGVPHSGWTAKMLQLTAQPQTQQQWRASSAAEFYAASIGFLRRQFPIITLIFLLCLVISAAYILMSERWYAGRAVLIVETPKMQLFQYQAPLSDAALNSASIDTQIQILNSDDIALSVIKELHLDEDAEFISSSSGILGTIRRFPGDLINGALRAIFPLAAGTSTQGSPEYRALQTFHTRLKVKRLAVTYAMEINFESRDAYRAAQVANTIADAYELNAFQAKYQITDRAAKWLQGRLQELREQASDSERAVVNYKANNNIVDTGGRLMNEQQLAELNSTLIQARASTAEAKARLDRVQQIVASGDIDPDDAAAATVADTLRNDVIAKLRTQYLEHERRAAQWGARYGAGHLAVVSLREQMVELRHSIFEELKRTAESYKSDYAIAKAREESIQQSLDRMASQSHATDEARITLRNLEASAQTSRDLYDSFLQRHMQSVQQQSSPVSDSRLITHARPPLMPSWPRPFLIMALGSLGGLIFGGALGALREISDRVFRSTQQIGEHLQANCIAVIPRVSELKRTDSTFEKAKAANPALAFKGTDESDSKLRFRMPISIPKISMPKNLWLINYEAIASPSRPLRRRRRRRTLLRDTNVCWMVANAPFSRFSESIRAVKVAADSSIVRANKTIGITSSLPNEGKSTVALSLATIINQGGGRAVLVDCDLRNPALSFMLTPDAKAGLLEIVAGKAAIEDVLWREPVTGLAFVPAVLTTRVAHSSDILASKEMRSLFDQLRAMYDYVIVDLSPLAPVVDVRVMTPLVDSFLFVVEWGNTKIEVAQHALTNARGVCDNLLGIVLNKADMRTFGRYANGQDSYYNNPYYGRYGYTD
jgi:polysaccharide biosynthesis transport protein